MKQSQHKTPFINSVHAPTGGTYQKTAQGIVWNRPPRKNELPPPPLSLMNFTAEIVSDVTQDVEFEILGSVLSLSL